MIRYFARHPTAANLLMLIFLVIGLLSIRSLRRETFPDYQPDEVEICVPYPGATAEEIEAVVCQRVEDALDNVRFVNELRSEAREGLGVVTVEMDDGADFTTFKDEIDTAVAAIDDFPEEVEDPVIEELHTTDLVLSLLVSGPMTAPDLKAYAEELKDRLQELPDISMVTLVGFSDHQFRVELSADALMRHNLSVSDVAGVISRQSVDLPVGTIETRERDILVRFVEQRTSVQELEDLVLIGVPGGAELRLRDLGQVIDLFELGEDQVVLNGRRAALLNIEKTKNQDTIRVATEVKELLDVERARYPNVEIQITQDQSTLVSDRLEMLITNGWQGMLLVFLTMWLFFNLRLSFWVVMSLPVSFLGAFFFAPHLDLTINLMTMVALLLALGLLMDDGIVIAENIATHRAKGKPALQASIDGVNEVAGGVLSSFLTTICVLGPLAFLAGNIGKVLLVVPVMLILVMSVSLVEAFMILPNHLAHALHNVEPGQEGRFRRYFDSGMEWVRENLLGRTIDVLIRWRYLWLGTVVLVFLAAVGVFAGGVVKFQAFPDMDGDVVVARVLMPPGTPLEKTEAVVDQITDALGEVNTQFAPLQPDQQDLVETVYVQFNINKDAFEAGPHVATVYVDLLAAEVRDARLDDIMHAWRERVGPVPDALSVVYAEPALGPAGQGIEIRLQAHDLGRLKAASLEMKNWLDAFKGVHNLAEDLRQGKPELRLRLREGTLGLGLDAATVSRQLRAAFQGMTADEIQVGSESYEIDVQLDPASQDSLEDLDYFRCTLPDGRQIPLAAVVEIERAAGWSRIARVDGRRTVTVRGDIDSRQTNTVQVISRLERDFLPELRMRYPDIKVSFEGEIKEAGITKASMLRGLLIGAIGVFVLLSFQFRSYIEPLIVMAAIPFALIGVIGGHLVMGIDISTPSMLGFVSLAGVVVNDSILLVLFQKMQRGAGKDVYASAAQASRQRFRAITITSLTTMAGLSPLLFERSLQAQVLIPLVVSIVFGLLASTVLVLLVIPCLYVVLEDLGLVSAIESRAK
ncbi:MAG: multidrug transporter AcrB [Phycisphaerae bacterium]